MEIEAYWYRLLCPLQQFGRFYWSRAGANLRIPLFFYRHPRISILNPKNNTNNSLPLIIGCLAWITELTKCYQITEKACPNNFLLRWCYYDEEETPVRGKLKVVYFVFGAKQCCSFSSHWKQKHHKWQSNFLQYASKLEGVEKNDHRLVSTSMPKLQPGRIFLLLPTWLE